MSVTVYGKFFTIFTKTGIFVIKRSLTGLLRKIWDVKDEKQLKIKCNGE